MELTREFTVAVFVVHDDRVLLHHHRKLAMWLPPGGHIEPAELPDDAAVREVAEETGVRAVLIGERALPLAYPRQLVRPAGIQLEDISPGHQHIDLVYFAVPEGGDATLAAEDAREPGTGWYALDELAALGANEEIQSWAARAVAAAGAWRAAAARGG
ncbi:MAG TPA: NUDIX domain-containing protein [Chloroflexota bacterium]|nr:NUDIX domain-containing protein [Chloroflexota bacterium]